MPIGKVEIHAIVKVKVNDIDEQGKPITIGRDIGWSRYRQRDIPDEEGLYQSVDSKSLRIIADV